MKNLKAIIFDLGAVILNINYKNTINEFKKLGVKNPESFYSKKTQINLFDKFEIGEISTKTFLLELQKATSNANVKEVKNAWNAMLLDLPINRINFLKQINKNYSIYLLSNTNALHIAEFKKKIGKQRYVEFYKLFQQVYYSYKIGFRKPNSKAFQLILNENKLPANRVLFVDDSPQHIVAAKKIGLQTHHLKDNEEITTLLPDIIQ